MWQPGLSCVEVTADKEEEAAIRSEDKGSLVAFSGGVDSCFTAFRHARPTTTRFPCRVTAGIMVHGFDIPLDEPATFTSAFERSGTMLSSLGLESIPMATNYRTEVAEWTHSFGAALASCLMLFSGRFKAGLIGQGLTYGELSLLHEGSNPLTDPLLSQ